MPVRSYRTVKQTQGLALGTAPPVWAAFVPPAVALLEHVPRMRAVREQ